MLINGDIVAPLKVTGAINRLSASIPWRNRVGAITVAVADRSVPPVNDNFHLVANRPITGLMDRFALRVVDRPGPLSAFALGRPPAVVWLHMYSERSRFVDGIDEATAEDLLRRDVETAERAVLRHIRVPLEDGQFDALGSFTFNLGSGALQRSTLRRKVNREEHAAVPAEFRRWVWAGGRKLKGLIRRREAEVGLYAG